ncbi:MAG: two-component regulator propeller domain-containing protein [Flavisolibacter sp.]
MKKILLLLMLFSSAKCFAQNNTSRHHFNLLSIKDGMPEGTVTDMLQDKQGYIWIGTQKGLVRYDGYKPKVYDFGIKNPYHMHVSRIFEDSKGRLWAAVFNGLYMYDRAHDTFVNFQQWKVGYNFGETEDAAGDLWLSVQDSLMRFNPVTKKTEIFSIKGKGKYRLNARNFFQLYKDKRQRIWVCSDNGLYEYNGKEDTFIGHLAHSDSSEQVTTWLIQEDARQAGIFYFDIYNTYPSGLHEGFGTYNSNTDSLTVLHHNPKDAGSIASDTISTLYSDSKGRLWIPTFSGLSLFNPFKKTFTNYFPDPVNSFGNSAYLISLKEDKAGNLWLNSYDGLSSFNINTGQFERDTTESNFANGLADNMTHNLFIDNSGIVWFGAGQLGLQWIDTRRSRWIQYGNEASADISFKAGKVSYITKAADGSIWIAAKNGLYRKTPADSFTLVKHLPGKGKSISVENTNISSNEWIAIASNGLIGAWNNDKGKTVFYCYDPATGKTIDFPYNLKDTASDALNNVSSICKDHLGDLWIGTVQKGIWRYNRSTRTFTKFPFIQNKAGIANPNGALDDALVTCIFEDKEGTIWVGTNNGGLNRFNRDKGIFTSYVGRATGFDCVTNINEDSKGRLWASTFFGGLFELNKNRDSVKRFSEENGLLYDGIWAAKEDDNGNIWAATPRGISIINPATGKIKNITDLNNLTISRGDGMIKTRDGNFYIPTNKGFIALNPDDFAADKKPPVAHIELVHLTTFINDKPKDSTIVVDGVRRYKFDYNENRITFNYVGLYYKDPLATQYAYKLDGYDKGWVQAGTQRTVTYINLSPGKYTFHVKAGNADGGWSDGKETLSFAITPPWWQTWWAYLLYAILAVMAVWSFVAYRSRVLKQHNKILEYKVQLRTAEVLEQKEEITAQRDNLEKTLDELQITQKQLVQQEKMASLGELTAGIAHEIQNPLNFVNNFSDVNKELIAEMKDEINNSNYEEVKLIAKNIGDNEEKINHHGKRADAIVKGMLQHSRKSSGQKEPTDINALADEYLRLSYHGLRAKDKNFNATIETDFDNSLGKINVIPQDIGRVLLNLFNNAFYAVNEQKIQNPILYNPTVFVRTQKCDDKVQITVRDNGNGIPQKIIDKIFQPFFTTKPTGQGTGLGLSLSYDIIKAHGGEIKVESKEGEGSEFVIQIAA